MGRGNKRSIGRHLGQTPHMHGGSSSKPTGVSKEKTLTKSAYERQKLKDKTEMAVFSQLLAMGIELDHETIQKHSTVHDEWTAMQKEDQSTWNEKAKIKYKQVKDDADIVKKDLEEINMARKKAEEDEREAKALKEKLGARVKEVSEEFSITLDAGMKALKRMIPNMEE